MKYVIVTPYNTILFEYDSNSKSLFEIDKMTYSRKINDMRPIQQRLVDFFNKNKVNRVNCKFYSFGFNYDLRTHFYFNFRSYLNKCNFTKVESNMLHKNHCQIKELTLIFRSYLINEKYKIVVCGSFNKHLKFIENLINLLSEQGHCVLSPTNTHVVDSIDKFVLFEGDVAYNNCSYSVELKHLCAIDQADCVIICDIDNYLGLKTTMEVGYSLKAKKKIIFVEDNRLIDDFDIPCEIGLDPMLIGSEVAPNFVSLFDYISNRNNVMQSGTDSLI